MTSLGLTDLLTVAGLGVVLLVVTQLVKGFVPASVVPHVAVVAGVVIAVAASAALGKVTTADLASAVVTGFLAGAASTGLYEQQRFVGVLPTKEPEVPKPIARG